MGGGHNHRRLARSMAVALVLAALGALGQLSGLPGASLTGSAQAQIPPREAPQISALSQATTSSIAVIWLPADNTDVHWLYAVKADGTDGRFQLAVPDPPQGASGQQGVTGTARTTTVSGLDAGTQYWFVVLGVRAPSEGTPDTWFRWSNWGRASTLTTPTVSLSADVTVAEGGTATLTVTAAPAPQATLTVNYAIGADDDTATVDGDGSDYTGMATGSISIATGATQGSIAVAITDDSDIDDGARETLVVTISLPEGSSYTLGDRASATVTITEGVCDRTAKVRDAIVAALPSRSACADVTDADLRGITGTLDLSQKSLTAVKARDFRGLAGLKALRLNHNSLAAVPADGFDGLDSLQELYLNNNALTALPEDVFDGLTNLATLSLSNNSLAALPVDVFDGLSSLAKLRLNNNSTLATLPADVFDGLSSLTTLRLNNNALTALPDDLFDGLTDLEGLFLANNPGSSFTFTAALDQTAATQVKVTVAQAAPFDLTVTLAVAGGSLSATSVKIPAGSDESSAVTVTPSGDAPVTVSVTAASFPASGVETGGVTIRYNGIQTGVGAANQAPTASAGADQSVDTGATVTLDASGSSDADTGDTLSYRWEQTAGTTLTLSSATASGPTFTAPSSAASLTFRLTVFDGKGGSDRDTVTVTVTANQPPAFTSGASFSLPEHTTAVGTVTATDPDADDSVTGYTLSGTDAALFAITSAGALAFSAAPDFEAPKGGTADDSNSYTLTITATGGAGARALTATQDLTVTVTDVNEAPAFTSDATFSLAENTTSVGSVVAADPDTADSVAFDLSGTDAALFAITTAGALSFSAAPDFEDPKGGTDDDSNSYTLTVTATGGAGARALAVTQDLTVTVTDANEAPTFTSDATFSLAENVTAVGTVTATDPDAADSVTGYTLSGTDAARFAITGAGVLTFRAAPDFEEPKGGAADDSNSYALTVTATSGAGARALTATQDLTVTVTDVNEAPTITSDATFSLAENLTAVGTVAAADPDAADSVTFALSGTDAALFAITAAGVLSFSAAPDFESPKGGADDDSNTYTLTVTATGGTGDRALTVTQNLTVTVTNVVEPPVFGEDSYAFSVAENAAVTTTIGTVSATDPEGGTVIYYDIRPRTGSFAMDALHGRLVVAATLDHETKKSFTLTARAVTPQEAATTVTVTITVTDVNEAPAFTSGGSFSLAENTTAVGTVASSDPDAADSVTGYNLSGTDAALFAITSADVLTFSAAPNFEDPKGGTADDSNSYTLTVTATGGADDRALTATQDLTVTVTDVNEAPAFTSDATFSLAENTTSVGTVVAADPDAADSVTYSLSGTDSALFAITTAGALSFSSAPDFESPKGGTNDNSNTYTLTVTATGGAGDRALTATQDLTVTVTNVDETPPPRPTPTPAPVESPGAPRDFKAEVDGSYVNLSWSAPSDDGGARITHYSLEWRQVDRTGYTSVGRLEGTSHRMQVVPDIVYDFRVAAHNSAGRGTWKNIYGCAHIAASHA